MSRDHGSWLILRCQGCGLWCRFHEEDLDEHRILDELAVFVPKHIECGAQIDMSVLPAQRHAPHSVHPLPMPTVAE